MMSTPGQSSRYLPHFDAIRGVAILGVFLFHATDAALQRGRSESLERVGGPDSFGLFRYGVVGVGAASHQLWRDSRRVVLRAQRLLHPPQSSTGAAAHVAVLREPAILPDFPPYIVALCLFIFVWPWGGLEMLKSPYWVQQLLMHLPAVHNFHPETLYGVNPSFWTLAVEVQLYALYPVLVWLRRRFDWPTTLGILGAGEFSIRLLPLIAPLGHDVAMPTFVLWSPFAFWFSWSLGATQQTAF